ncbi:MAG: penicillin acylase family protein [Promethearchaeota archaeon]
MEELLKIAKNAFPPVQGTEKIRGGGLKDKVEILWDKWGIPHVHASTAEDAYFAQGYIHAQHRLWQMETFRRLISGELAEIIGESALSSDRHYRMIGLHRIARRCAKEIRKRTRDNLHLLLDSYVRGVNYGISKARKNPPLEFAILNIEIRDWTLEDSLKILSMIEWGLSNWNYPFEILREQLVLKLGEEMANKLIPLNGGIYMKNSMGSNGWVAGPKKTKSGIVLFAGDPHLPTTNPAIWFLIHLHCPEFNVIGSSFAGIPMVVLGHNEKIAWSCTNVHADTIDLFKLVINPDNPYQYKCDDKWLNFEVIKEKIAVKDSPKPEILEVLISKFGPVVKYFERDNTIYEIDLHGVYSLRWSSYDANLENTIEGFIKLNRAENWKEFRDALSLLTINPQNFIYGDVQGNIGLQHGGKVPIRSRGNGCRITLGTSEKYNWKGLSKFDQLLSIYNPEDGFVYTANFNENIAPNGVLLAADMSEPYRQFRIKSLLESKDDLTLEDFKNFQLDYYTLEAQELLPLMLEHLKKIELPDDIKYIISLLEEWDYKLTKETVSGTIYKVWWEKNIIELLKPYIEEELLKPHFGYCPFELERLFKLYQEKPQELSKLLLKTLQETINFLSEKISPNHEKWKWSKLHQLTLAHPFSSDNEQAKILNIGPFKVGGDTNTINNGYYNPFNDYTVSVAPSFRQLHDLSDWRKSLCVIPGGQSGLPFHEHYNDLIKSWVKGKYIPMLFYKKEIEENLEGRLELIP